jgi:DNA-binding MarR family transcriptional regulator
VFLEIGNPQKIYRGANITRADYQSDLCADEKVLMAVVRMAEVFKRSVSATFRKYKLSFPQYNVLRVLDASKDGQGRITNVSRIMLVPGANMTGIAKRLEKGGFLTRSSDPNDERVTLLRITPKGKTMLTKIEKERDQHMQAMLLGFSEEEKEELLDKVRRLIRNSGQPL